MYLYNLKMLSKARTSLFSVEEDQSSRTAAVPVGLRILTQISQGKSNIVVKSALRLRPPATSRSQRARRSVLDPCFLTSCCLCNKKLSEEKDVYMYRGDLGFCSVECRSRQIVVDEMREIETSTKKMVSSCGQCRSSSGYETHVLLQQLRRPRKALSPRTNEVIFSYG